MEFDVTINTPQGLYKQTRASIVNVVSEDGQRGILPNHMPIVVSLAVGKMTMEEESGRETYAVSGGVLFFRNNQCTILTRAIENVKDIDVERAERAKERAEARLAAIEDEHIDMMRAEIALKKAVNRLNIKHDTR
jgi:F-type H+-transporting ATPase subunit epsilon